MTSAAGVGCTTAPPHDVMAISASSHWWGMVENVLEPTTSRKNQGKGDAQMPRFLYINKDGCGCADEVMLDLN